MAEQAGQYMDFYRFVSHLQQHPVSHVLHGTRQRQGDFPDTRQRNRIAHLVDTDHQRHCNQQGEREIQRKLRPASLHSFDLDAAVHRTDHAFDDIHSDAAAGLIG